MGRDTSPRDESACVQAADSFLQVEDACLRYRDEGRGEAVIFIHGWTLDLDMWEPQIAALSAAFRVIRLDRRGFGLSSGRPSLAHDLSDLHALCRHLKLRTAAMVGMSQGARVVLELSRSPPATFSCLVLDGPPQMGAAGTQDVPFQHYRALARSLGMDAFRREWMQHPLATLRTREPGARELLCRMIARYPGKDLLDAPQEGTPAAAIAWAPANIRVPVLVIGGELDLESRKAAAGALAAQLPTAERATIPRAGHLCNLDNPEAYNAALGAFLVRHAPLPRTH